MATNLQQLHQQIANMRQSLFDDEVLLEERFVQIEALNNDDNPDFIKDTLNLFIKNSTSCITSIEDSLKKEPIEGDTIERMVCRLKSATLSIGACKMRDELDQMREYCRQKKWESLKASFQVLKEEGASFKNPIQPYLELLKQISFPKAHNGVPEDN